ncbi:serine threonine kinase [Pyrenophora seminiperda CCB06]|uniref:Serine threonine kinase n=1 Tax=Pyrenophora seminiperda CCB06 TaxID=1302712 RepID=A0A3M7M2S8_9PLEO|nr:serine threonine kinase [Pyrenophora seminiperda CCB06]
MPAALYCPTSTPTVLSGNSCIFCFQLLHEVPSEPALPTQFSVIVLFCRHASIPIEHWLWRRSSEDLKGYMWWYKIVLCRAVRPGLAKMGTCAKRENQRRQLKWTHSRLELNSMSSLFRIGQVLKGRTSTYTITKELRDTVWFAKNHLQELVVIKSVHNHPRVENERDVLKRFQRRTPYLRPLIDEIDEPSVPVTITLRYLQGDLLASSVAKTLNRRELKYVSRCVLEALQTLHEDGFVHTALDVKPDNVFVNLQEGDMRFSDVQLGDLGGCYPAESGFATSGTMVGAPIWSSPELINLIYGGHFNLFHPKDLKRDDEEYMLGVFEAQFRFFGPFSAKIAEIADQETAEVFIYVMKQNPGEKLTPFSRMTKSEVSERDNIFISKMMKLDWRDRPTAKELLEDEWWNDDAE